MKVNGYYIWCRKQDGKFLTIFLPTTNYDMVNRYFEENQEIENLGSLFSEKIFNENEKNELLSLFLELNNLY